MYPLGERQYRESAMSEKAWQVIANGIKENRENKNKGKGISNIKQKK